MTLSDWTMSCQPGPPCTLYGQWPRWQQRPVGYTFPYKMANFHGVYLKLGHTDSAEFFILHSEKYLSYCYKIWKWYDESVLCYRRVESCNFAMSKQGPSHYFHLHARAPPTAVPGCVDKRIYECPIFKWVAGITFDSDREIQENRVVTHDIELVCPEAWTR